MIDDGFNKDDECFSVLFLPTIKAVYSVNTSSKQGLVAKPFSENEIS